MAQDDLGSQNVIKKKSTKAVNVATFNVIFAVMQCDLCDHFM